VLVFKKVVSKSEFVAFKISFLRASLILSMEYHVRILYCLLYIGSACLSLSEVLIFIFL